MKQLKNIIAFLLVICLAATTLLACRETGKETSAPEGTTAAPEQTNAANEKIDYAGQLKLDMNSNTKKQEVTVHLYVDGDTTQFNVPTDVSESGILKARYLGINTPESTGTIEKWGKAASKFTREKLSTAAAILVESDDDQWNFDNTSSHRCLLFIWYKPDEQSDYRNLNLEILQEGYAVASNSGGNRYGETMLKALAQAKALGLHVHSDEVDPLFYEGDTKEVTIKAIRTDPTPLVGINVAFEGVIVREYSNTLYVEEYDEEDGVYYGIPVYYGFNMNSSALAFMKIGNRVRFVGSVQYYEAGGTYQVSGLQYKPRKPEESCRLVSEGHEIDYVLTDPAEFLNGKKSVIIEKTSESGDSLEFEKEFDLSELLLSTSVEMKDIKVRSIYTTKNEESSMKGAMTLTCEAPDGTLVPVRTVVLYDENKELVTEDAYAGKTIDVRGIVDFYDGAAQIKVFSVKDITVRE